MQLVSTKPVVSKCSSYRRRRSYKEEALSGRAALSAHEQPEEWQLESGLLSKMAQAKRVQIPSALALNSVHTSGLKSGSSH